METSLTDYIAFSEKPVKDSSLFGYERYPSGLREAAAWVECKVLHTWAHGDHTVVVGEVVEAGVRRAAEAPQHRDTGWHYGG